MQLCNRPGWPVKPRTIVCSMLYQLCAVLADWWSHNINQPFAMSFISFIYLQNCNNCQYQLFLLRALFIDTCYSGTPWHHWVLSAPGRNLLTLESLLHPKWCLVLKHMLLIPTHGSISVLVSTHHLMTSYATQKLKSLSKEKYSNKFAGGVLTIPFTNTMLSSSVL